MSSESGDLARSDEAVDTRGVRVRTPSIRDDVREEESPRREPPRSPADLLQLQRTAGNRAVQRLIIGIQDAADFGKEQTIYDSTAEQKGRREITQSPGSEHAAVFPEGEPAALEEKFKSRTLGQNEPLIIVAHGGAPTVLTSWWGGKTEVLPTLGGYEPKHLAALVANVVPAQYSGLIYLCGCDTAVRLDWKPGTSFIERFGAELFRRRPHSHPLIRGNMGEAATVGGSTETIEIPKVWIEQHPRFKAICQMVDCKYYVDSPTGGEAHYSPDRDEYQSIFLSLL
jgi:hypothetical protein